ncbi:MAG: MBL fold metallo-hydrolase [Parcubacteria group bacterium]|nr:MBL fold metallo-hydrolase [Parcubacteria group bacterium]
MQIQWYGQSFFRIETQGTVIAIDPFSKMPDWGISRTPRFKANVLLISHEHQDHNNTEAIEGEPLVFRGPGEYEVGGIFIEGIHSFHDNQSGHERGTNTIFVVEAEDLRVCHLGDFGESKLSAEQLEKIGRADVVMVPVGGKFTIGPGTAANIVSQLEPKVVIPMHFKVSKQSPLESVQAFLKEMSAHPESEEKLSIRARDLPTEGTRVHLLKALAFS